MAASWLQFARFRVEKNLTEINHKVSLIAKSFERGIGSVFVAKWRIIPKGAVVQDAFIGNWTAESHLSAEHLSSIRNLNHRFLDLAGARANQWIAAGRDGPTVVLGRQLAPLSPAQRAAAANCPYALFDLRFEDDAHWNLCLQNPAPWRVAEETCADEETTGFVRLALFYTWHLASSAGLAAHLLFGMHGDTANAFRRISVDRLPALAEMEADNLTARWSTCNAYWNALIGAAARTDTAALRRVQLSGLQLIAASGLPSI
jgi:hypothetical protein